MSGPRKAIVLILSGLLLAGAIAAAPAGAKKAKKRVAKASYEQPAPGVGGVIGICSGDAGCPMFPAMPSERTLSVVIKDDTGQNVFARVAQDIDGDGQSDEATPLCGKTAEPVEIQPGAAIRVYVYAIGISVPPCPGIATSGEITVTFNK